MFLLISSSTAIFSLILSSRAIFESLSMPKRFNLGTILSLEASRFSRRARSLALLSFFRYIFGFKRSGFRLSSAKGKIWDPRDAVSNLRNLEAIRRQTKLPESYYETKIDQSPNLTLFPIKNVFWKPNFSKKLVNLPWYLNSRRFSKYYISIFSLSDYEGVYFRS